VQIKCGLVKDRLLMHDFSNSGIFMRHRSAVRSLVCHVCETVVNQCSKPTVTIEH